MSRVSYALHWHPTVQSRLDLLFFGRCFFVASPGGPSPDSFLPPSLGWAWHGLTTIFKDGAIPNRSGNNETSIMQHLSYCKQSHKHNTHVSGWHPQVQHGTSVLEWLDLNTAARCCEDVVKCPKDLMAQAWPSFHWWTWHYFGDLWKSHELMIDSWLTHDSWLMTHVLTGVRRWREGWHKWRRSKWST